MSSFQQKGTRCAKKQKSMARAQEKKLINRNHS